MNKIKVLMVGPDRGVHGGISAVVNELYGAGLDKKVDLRYIGTMKEGSKLKKLLVAALAYARFLKELSWCDVVHVHFSSDNSFLRKSYFIKTAYRKGKKILLHQHGGDFQTFYGSQLDDKGRLNVRRTLAMGNKMLVLTKGWKDFFSQIVDENKIVVFPNGIKTSALPGNERTLDERDPSNTEMKVKKDYDKVLFLGRICKDKGIDELLHAVKSVHEYYPRVHLYIGGIFEDPSYKSKIEDCKEFVTYLGWVSGEEKERYLDECGIFTLPSYFEGFGLVIIEAMLHKDAVVASNVGGIPEIIRHEENGLLIPAKDSKALEKEIFRIIKDEALRKRMGQNGRGTVLEKYSVEKNVEILEKIYESLLLF